MNYTTTAKSPIAPKSQEIDGCSFSATSDGDHQINIELTFFQNGKRKTVSAWVHHGMFAHHATEAIRANAAALRSTAKFVEGKLHK